MIDLVILAAAIALRPTFVQLARLAGAWLQARPSRKVRLKVSPEGIELEVQTIQQLRDAFPIAAQYQRSFGKVIIYDEGGDQS